MFRSIFNNTTNRPLLQNSDHNSNIPNNITSKNNNYQIFSIEERIELLKKYGNQSSSFLTLQPKMEYFDIPEIGYLAYTKYKSTVTVLSNPICAADNYEFLINEFLKIHYNAQFIQINKIFFELLCRKFGYFGSNFGMEYKLNIANWNLKGRKKQGIRSAVNKAKSLKIVVNESIDYIKIKKISDDWIRTRNCKKQDLKFLVAPLESDIAGLTRHFFAYQFGQPIGFIFFDPLFDKDQLIGYIPNLSRANSHFKQGLWYVIMNEAIEKFRHEGINFIDLGLVPFLIDKQREPLESRYIRLLCNFFYHYTNWLFNAKGLAFTKSRMDGWVEKTYFCNKKKYPVFSIWALFKQIGIL
jgi:phosphatidylglycerol lysyltransferase